MTVIKFGDVINSPLWNELQRILYAERDKAMSGLINADPRDVATVATLQAKIRTLDWFTSSEFKKRLLKHDEQELLEETNALSVGR